MENEEILADSGSQLDQGRRLLKETEDIGASVLSDLGQSLKLFFSFQTFYFVLNRIRYIRHTLNTVEQYVG